METVIVITPTIITIETIELVKWPIVNPIATIMNENSDIWATVSPDRYDVLLRKPSAPKIDITIIGFPNSTNAENIKAGPIADEKSPTTIRDPKRIKNIVKKKSLSGLVLEAIWKCSGKLDKESPAKKPPISNEKPKGPATKAATPNAHAILIINNKSCECP